MNGYIVPCRAKPGGCCLRLRSVRAAVSPVIGKYLAMESFVVVVIQSWLRGPLIDPRLCCDDDSSVRFG